MCNWSNGKKGENRKKFEINYQNFFNLMRNISLQFQETKATPGSINIITHTYTPWYIIMKLQKTSDKAKVLDPARLCRETTVRFTADFSFEIM